MEIDFFLLLLRAKTTAGTARKTASKAAPPTPAIPAITPDPKPLDAADFGEGLARFDGVGVKALGRTVGVSKVRRRRL